MSATIANEISSTLNSNSLWGEVSSILPVILPLILFGFGFFLFRRVLNSTRHGTTRA